MVLAEWTKTESGGTGDLDAVTKFEGLTSFKAMITASGSTNAYVKLSRVAAANVRLILCAKLNVVISSGSLTARLAITHDYNGNEFIVPLQTASETYEYKWKKYRVSFWKDLDTGILWARIEYLYYDAITDTMRWKFTEDFELGIASFGTIITLLLDMTGDGEGTAEAWFDEVEVITE